MGAGSFTPIRINLTEFPIQFARYKRLELKFRLISQSPLKVDYPHSFSRLSDDFSVLACELIRRLKLISMGVGSFTPTYASPVKGEER
jgi:hypothetical protein